MLDTMNERLDDGIRFHTGNSKTIRLCLKKTYTIWNKDGL